MKRTKNYKGSLNAVISIVLAVLVLIVGLYCLLARVQPAQNSVSEQQNEESDNTDSSANGVRSLSAEEKEKLIDNSQISDSESTMSDVDSDADVSYLDSIQGGEMLQSGITETLVEFLDEYFSSQTSFHSFFKSMDEVTVPDMTHWFTDPESLSAVLWQNALLYECAAKTVNSYDLGFSSCSYSLTITDVSFEDEKVILSFTESDEVYFSYLNGIKSTQQGIDCQAVLVESEDGWQFESYYRHEDFYMAIYNYITEDTQTEDVYQLCLNALSRYCSNYLTMMQDKSSFNSGTVKYYSAENAYDRKAAGSYASLYALSRSSDWPNYDELGGNGQNYASQVLYAGGIPMDTIGEAIWKYYGPDVDETDAETGRTPSWISASFFHDYALCNSGKGLACTVGANTFAAEIGDIFQSGSIDNEINKSSVVTALVEDDGEVTEILLSSNSPDRENWPMTATFDSEISLIKIQGWLNE